MESQRTTGEAQERKVLRRGLLAGLAGVVAAAMLKVTGTEKAEAVHGGNMLIGSLNTEDTGQRTFIVGDVAGNPTFVGYNGVAPFSNGSADGLQGTTEKVTNFAAGVRGIGKATTGTPIGVHGVAQGSGTIGIGVLGASPGVAGAAPALTSTLGVVGVAAGQGVRGVGFSNGIGVEGVSNSGAFNTDITPEGTGSGIGVLGKSSTGTAVKGISPSGIGVFGLSDAQVGVFGQSSAAPGVEGTSSNSLGIRGTSTNFVGIVGISTNNHGLYGSTSGLTSYGIIAENTGGGPGLFVTGSAFINGSLQVTGAKNAVIKMQDGTNAVVYCQEAPEPYFEDFGEARLANGVAQVALEPEFAALVSGGKYMVFLTAEGVTQAGLYVSRKNGNGFEVRENSGTSNVPFSYRVVTKRKDIEGKRFARVSDDAKHSVAAARAAIERTPGPAGHP